MVKPLTADDRKALADLLELAASTLRETIVTCHRIGDTTADKLRAYADRADDLRSRILKGA